MAAPPARRLERAQARTAPAATRAQGGCTNRQRESASSQGNLSFSHSTSTRRRTDKWRRLPEFPPMWETALEAAPIIPRDCPRNPSPSRTSRIPIPRSSHPPLTAKLPEEGVQVIYPVIHHERRVARGEIIGRLRKNIPDRHAIRIRKIGRVPAESRTTPFLNINPEMFAIPGAQHFRIFRLDEDATNASDSIH